MPEPGTDSGPESHQAPRDWFASTHWSVVLAAGAEQTADAGVALERLCQTYWPPIYAFLRRGGHALDDAKDLTQAFFAQLLSRQAFSRADPARGRFRDFLLAALRHHLADVHDRATALKRGGVRRTISLEPAQAEALLSLEASPGLSPDQCYDRAWALTLLERVLERVGQEFSRTHRAEMFGELKAHLWGQADAPYREIATRLGVSENSLRVSVHRLRQQFREQLRAEVAHTVTSPEEIDAEIRYLAGLLP